VPSDSFRSYQEGDREGILALAGKVFGDLGRRNATFPHTRAWFDWRAKAHPHGLPDIALAVGPDGRIVANQWMEHYRLDTPEGRIPLGLASLTMADPDHGGFGGLKTMNAASKRAKAAGLACYGLPNDLSLPMFQRMGWAHIGNIPVLVRPAVSPFRLTAKGLFAGRHRVERVERFDQGIEELTAHPDLPYRYKVARDADVLNWRYVDNPLQSYDKHVITRDGDRVAYVVSRTGRLANVPCGLIMDLLALDAAAFHVALSMAMRGFRRRGMLAASVFCVDGGWVAGEYRKRGFFRVPEEFMPKQNAMIVLDDGTHPGILDLSNWHLAYGDWDCL